MDASRGLPAVWLAAVLLGLLGLYAVAGRLATLADRGGPGALGPALDSIHHDAVRRAWVADSLVADSLLGHVNRLSRADSLALDAFAAGRGLVHTDSAFHARVASMRLAEAASLLARSQRAGAMGLALAQAQLDAIYLPLTRDQARRYDRLVTEVAMRRVGVASTAPSPP
jgi:hypothetical protein